MDVLIYYWLVDILKYKDKFIKEFKDNLLIFTKFLEIIHIVGDIQKLQSKSYLFISTTINKIYNICHNSKILQNNQQFPSFYTNTENSFHLLKSNPFMLSIFAKKDAYKRI